MLFAVTASARQLLHAQRQLSATALEQMRSSQAAGEEELREGTHVQTAYNSRVVELQALQPQLAATKGQCQLVAELAGRAELSGALDVVAALLEVAAVTEVLILEVILIVSWIELIHLEEAALGVLVHLLNSIAVASFVQPINLMTEVLARSKLVFLKQVGVEMKSCCPPLVDPSEPSPYESCLPSSAQAPTGKK